MTRLQEALLLAIVLLAVALLAVFDIVPEAVAQFAPLAAIPFIVRRRPACAGRLTERGA
ncbi:MAG: hypothetical protein GW858_09210 [Sphingomonadales bacterium]|nr:hypothetical protein [Sphingomonadales bacterium]NCQ20079.1 hypothetical protein [Sphingomonadales bacterium]NCT02490.1 hypothetical protein [Sphingomonadales bacterium]